MLFFAYCKSSWLQWKCWVSPLILMSTPLLTVVTLLCSCMDKAAHWCRTLFNLYILKKCLYVIRSPLWLFCFHFTFSRTLLSSAVNFLGLLSFCPLHCKAGRSVQWKMYIKPNWYIPMKTINVSCDHYNLKCLITINGTDIPSGERSLRPKKGCVDELMKNYGHM